MKQRRKSLRFDLLTRPTWYWVFAIWSFAFYMRQVLNISVALLGKTCVHVLLWFGFVAAAVALGIAVRKKLFRFSALTAFVFLAGVAYAAILDIAEERVHILKYGILGWLVLHDVRSLSPTHALIHAVVIAGFVSCLDETIQYFLPYRVGDPRDVLFGLIGSLWGGLLYMSTHPKEELSLSD